jgi:hypothetical protein
VEDALERNLGALRNRAHGIGRPIELAEDDLVLA